MSVAHNCKSEGKWLKTIYPGEDLTGLSRVLFDNEITLSSEKETQFAECKKLIGKSARKLQLEKVNKQFDRTMSAFYVAVPATKRNQFVMFGTGR